MERKGETERWLLFRQRERRKKDRLRYEISVRIGESQMTEIGRGGEERRNRSHVDRPRERGGERYDDRV